VSQYLKQLLVLVMEIQHYGPLPRDTQQMDADNVLEHPPALGVLAGLPRMDGKRCLEGRAGVLGAAIQRPIYDRLQS
jgi:hypothetical protein